MTSPRLLEGQNALVVGAGRGVGQAAALAFARNGANILAAGIRVENLEKTVEECRALGVRALAVGCDIASEDDVKATVLRTVEEYGRLDIVLNAAVWMDPPGSLLDMSKEVWDKTMAVDFTGPFLLSKHSLKIMLEQNSGRLIHISSEVGMRGSMLRGAYAAAKAGLINLVKSLALTTVDSKVKINAICPMGIGGEHNRIMRGMFAELHGVEPESPADYEAVRMTMMQPEEVAELAVFLASKAGGRVNGQAIIIGEGSSSGGPAPGVRRP